MTILTNGQRPVQKHRTRPNQIAFKGGNMADLDVTKKLHVYHLLYRLNLSFAAIVRRCREFQQTRRFSSKDLIMYQGLAQELQADINQSLLETLEQDELDDWARFGKVSAAREKELRDPDDVFIQAEERRKQLAISTRHSGKPKSKNKPQTKS
jgi:hypothetical protein